MVQNNQNWNRLLDIIYNEPNTAKTVRTLAKESKLAVTTTKRYLDQLKKQQILNKENTLINNNYTKFHKTFHLINLLHKSNLLNHLTEKINPENIILFGSVRKGEYTKDSDIDLFIETTSKTKPNIKIFEKKLKKRIDLFIEPRLSNLPKPLQNNIINGIKLQGYLNYTK